MRITTVASCASAPAGRYRNNLYAAAKNIHIYHNNKMLSKEIATVLMSGSATPTTIFLQLKEKSEKLNRPELRVVVQKISVLLNKMVYAGLVERIDEEYHLKAQRPTYNHETGEMELCESNITAVQRKFAITQDGVTFANTP